MIKINMHDKKNKKCDIYVKSKTIKKNYYYAKHQIELRYLSYTDLDYLQRKYVKHQVLFIILFIYFIFD